MAACNTDLSNVPAGTDDASGSSGSDSGSTEEEERLRRLFTACDRDGDGYIDSHDLQYMCVQLNLEDSVDEIMMQLGVDKTGQISFQDFMQCRQRLMTEIEQEKIRVEVQTSPGWIHTDSDHSSGLPPSSQDYDSGARDMSPEPPSLYTLLEKNNPEYLQQVMNTQYGPGFLEVANALHLTALTSLKSEVIELSNRLQHLSSEKELVDRQLSKYKAETIRQQEDYGDKLEQQTRRYEDRITELHSVIAELKKKLDQRKFNIIKEEDEELEEECGDQTGAIVEEEGSLNLSLNENLSVNDSLSFSESLNENNANQSAENSTGPLDWETEMSQVIHSFNKALMERQQPPPTSLMERQQAPPTSLMERQQAPPTSLMDRQQAPPTQAHKHHPGLTSPHHHGNSIPMHPDPAQPVHCGYDIPPRRPVNVYSNNSTSGINSESQGVSQKQWINPNVQVGGQLREQTKVTAIHSSDGKGVSSSPSVGFSGPVMSHVYSVPCTTSSVSSGGGASEHHLHRANNSGLGGDTSTQLPVYVTPPYSQSRFGSQQNSNSSQQQQPPVPSVLSTERVSHDVLLANHPLLAKLRDDNLSLQEQIGKLEQELQDTRQHLGQMKEERDHFRNRVKDLQSRVHKAESQSPSQSRTGTPTKVPQSPVQNKSLTEDVTTAPKIAELKRLKTAYTEKQILGVDILSSLPNAKVAEHLVQNLQECSSVQEIVQKAANVHSISDNKVREFEIEVERLQSKIDHLKSQNELLALALEESKGHCDRMSVLVGKYESNQTALHLAVSLGDQLTEVVETIVSLLDSEQNLLLANCRAAGLGSTATTDSGMGDEPSDELADLILKAKASRKSSESVAKQLLQRLERTCGPIDMSRSQSQTGITSPWEELSFTSRTTSTTSSTGSNSDMDFSKLDEQRLREHGRQLAQERAAVRLTVMELESSGLVDPECEKPTTLQEGQKLDLENAVLMQELMAMKEEKAELKAQNYLLEKEKATLDLQLSGKESQEQAYIVQIEHLKSEVTEWKQKLGHHDIKGKLDDDKATPSITLAELRSLSSMDSSQMAQDLAEALKREQLLRKRVSELMATLERLSKNSETRHKQSAEFVSDLKKANSALVAAFEKAKKKYQSKLKKMETQLRESSEQYENQISILQKQLVSGGPSNPVSHVSNTPSPRGSKPATPVSPSKENISDA